MAPSAAEQYGMAKGGDAGDALDLTGILQFLRRRRLIIIASVIIFAVLATAAAFILPPKYTAITTLELGGAKTNIVQANQQVTTDAVLDSPAAETAVVALQSPEVAGRVVDALGPRFVLPSATFPWLHSLATLFTPAGPPPTAQQIRIAKINSLLGNLVVTRVGLGYAINIAYTSPSSSLAAEVPNLIAEHYLLTQSGASNAATGKATGWLAARLDGLRQAVVSAQSAVAQYKSSNGLLESTPDQGLTQQSISALNAQLAEARANRAEAEAQLSTARQQLQGASNGDDVGAVSSSAIGALRTQRASISGQLAQMKATYGPKYPGLASLEQQLADINQQISGETARVISGLSAQATAASQREASLQGSLGSQQAFLGKSTSAQVKLNELQSNADSAAQVYQSFLDRYRQTAAQQGLDVSDDKIIGIATPPSNASFPKPLIFIAAGIIFGGAVGLGLAFFLELLERGLRTTEDVERYLKQKPLANVPDLASTLRRRDQARSVWPPDYLAKAPLSRFTETFRSLITSLSLEKEDGASHVVAVASTLPGEGKTTTTICLARAAGMSGLKVLVIDCDLRRGELSKLLFGERKSGIVEVLSGQTTYKEAILPDPLVNNVSYLSSLAGEPGAPDILGVSTLDALLAEVRADYDLVLIDTAPVLALAETRVIARKADGVMFIVRWAETPMQAARKAINDLLDSGANVIGVTLTQVDVRKAASAGYGEAMYTSGMSKYYTSEAMV
jgi:capsular exopolysaccharide synthesis family protein